MTKKIPLAAALAAFAMACADPISPTRTLVGDVSLATSSTTTATPPVAFGSVELCKTSNVGGDFDFDATYTAGTALVSGTLDTDPDITIPAGGGTVCMTIYSGSTLPNRTNPQDQASTPLADQIVIVETANAVPLTNIDIIRYLHPDPSYDATVHLGDAFNVGSRSATVKINSDMSRRVTFTNLTTVTAPVCDFITFGRLVTDFNGQKVVVSGNAGGFNADGSIKGEFHIEVNGTDHHVHDISTYGPIGSGALLSTTYTNSRLVTGLDTHGHLVTLHLWDGGEPGKDTDRVWFNVAGTTVGHAVNGQFIDQGNMQYHANCRGPDPD